MAEIGDGVCDLVEAFDYEGRYQLTRSEGCESSAAVYWWGEVLWIGGLETGEEVELH